MLNTKVFQIFYSEDTKQQNDQGFYQLDNLKNERPDWSEYWPIRNFFMNNELDCNTYYGFFSPKFKAKTNLNSEDVFKLIHNFPDFDVYLFSPFFDQSAFFKNIFEQAEAQHPGILDLMKTIFFKIDGSSSIDEMIMSSQETVFSNFIVAKPNFWKAWFDFAEKVFLEAESKSLLAAKLNLNTHHNEGEAPNKVFVIERIASYILSSQSWKIKAYDPMKLTFSGSKISQYKKELCILDALKISYIKTENFEYMKRFYEIRAAIINNIKNNMI